MATRSAWFATTQPLLLPPRSSTAGLPFLHVRGPQEGRADETAFRSGTCCRDAAAGQRARGRRARSHFPQVDGVSLQTPNDKLATYGVDDPIVDGVACHFTAPEKGGWKGWLGLAEEVSDISLACRQVGPIKFTGKFEQGDDVFRRRRSLFFKKMQIVRGCDVKRNVLVYMVYSDRSSKARRRTRPRACRSCLGARAATSRSAGIGWSNLLVSWPACPVEDGHERPFAGHPRRAKAPLERRGWRHVKTCA